MSWAIFLLFAKYEVSRKKTHHEICQGNTFKYSISILGVGLKVKQDFWILRNNLTISISIWIQTKQIQSSSFNTSVIVFRSL